MSDLFSKSVEDSFDAWLADDSTHWVGDQDAAWQAWMYVNEQIVDPLNIQTEQLKAESAGLKTVYEAYERVNAGLNQRIANLELCQTASLGVSGIIKSAASEMGFDAAGEDSALDHLIGLARSAAALRAENEALKKRLAPMDNFNRQQVPVIGYTGCLVCGQFTDHGGLPCPKTSATAWASTSKEQSHD